MLFRYATLIEKELAQMEVWMLCNLDETTGWLAWLGTMFLCVPRILRSVCQRNLGEKRRGQASDMFIRSKYFRLLKGGESRAMARRFGSVSKANDEHRVQTRIPYCTYLTAHGHQPAVLIAGTDEKGSNSGSTTLPTEYLTFCLYQVLRTCYLPAIT